MGKCLMSVFLTHGVVSIAVQYVFLSFSSSTLSSAFNKLLFIVKTINNSFWKADGKVICCLSRIFVHNLILLVVVSSCMWTIKFCCNKIVQLLTWVLTSTG